MGKVKEFLGFQFEEIEKDIWKALDNVRLDFHEWVETDLSSEVVSVGRVDEDSIIHIIYISFLDPFKTMDYFKDAGIIFPDKYGYGRVPKGGIRVGRLYV